MKEPDEIIIKSQAKLFKIIVYYANYTDDWHEIKTAITQYARKKKEEQAVKDTARFLNDNRHFGQKDPKTTKIRSRYDSFELSKMDSSEDRYDQIELCPSEDGNSYFIRGGNTRLIAYAMKLLKGEEVSRPIRVGDYERQFTRHDRRNLDGMKTTQ